jgi:putative ABC transport system permease protein
VQEIAMNGAVLGFAAALSALTGVVFGLAPALAAARADLQETLKEGARGAVAGRHRLRSALVISEVALSLVLLVGAGLLLRSFYRLQQVHPGFERAGRVVFNVSLPDNRYLESKAWDLFFEKALANVSALPGVENAALGVNLPVTGIQIRLGMVRVEQASGPRANRTAPQYHAVSPGYFRTLGLALRRGREFDQRDRAGAPYVAIVSEALVRAHFANEDPLGQRVILGYGNDATGDQEIAYEIVGVVGDVRHRGPQRDPDPEIYTPFAQTPWSFGQFVVQTSAPSSALVAAARAAIAAVDPEVPVARVHTMDALLADTVAQERFRLRLLVAFAALAVTLAAVGIYGVMAYAVTQRTSEIGIRMALGADRRSVLWLVLRQGMTLTLVGVALGLAGALAGARMLGAVLEPLLFQVKLNDAATYGGVAAALTLVALAACAVPALRATRVDPLVALRYE